MNKKLRQRKEGYWPGRDDFEEFMATVEFSYQAGLKAGRKESFLLFAKLLRSLTNKRFPGTELYGEVEAIEDHVKLQQLCEELSDIPNAETLRRKIREQRAPEDSSPPLKPLWQNPKSESY